MQRLQLFATRQLHSYIQFVSLQCVSLTQSHSHLQHTQTYMSIDTWLSIHMCTHALHSPLNPQVLKLCEVQMLQLCGLEAPSSCLFFISAVCCCSCRHAVMTVPRTFYLHRFKKCIFYTEILCFIPKHDSMTISMLYGLFLHINMGTASLCSFQKLQ